MKNFIQSFGTPRLMIFIPLLISTLLCFGSSMNKVNEAFQLRIEGKAAQAEKLLKETINEDPSNAVAHFELARTLNYMNMFGSQEADSALNKALELEPDNVVFAYYYAKNCFLKAYIAMHQGNEAKDLVNKTCDEFMKVLELKPDYPEALMYLVEIYGYLPENMGGDKEKALQYQSRLEKLDKFYGAKAKLVLMDENTDKVEYWKNFINNNGESCQALKELGNACIFKDDIENAKKAFLKSMEKDNSQNIRLLDLARYHMMKVMQDQNKAAEELPVAGNYIDEYLNSSPEPIAPLKAYALGMKVKTKMFTGNRDEGEKIMAEAKAIDPFFSRAFGLPSISMFEPPTQTDHHFSSFFSPF